MNNIIKTDNAYVEATKKAFFEKLPEKIQKWAVLAPESADPNKYLYDRTIGVDGVQVPISTEGQIAANKELRQHNVPKTKPQAIPQEDTSTSPQLNSAPMKATPDTEPDGSGGVEEDWPRLGVWPAVGTGWDQERVDGTVARATVRV